MFRVLRSKLVNIHRHEHVTRKCCIRSFHAGRSSAEIRELFLDYFSSQQGHTRVPASSVIPYGDPTLTFVNAGMNQFKPIFLGQTAAPHKRVVNSQKCIRVGGKHNDLDDVGRDGYHHTFFEMLGSWSFNDYFKKEACCMAWQLLTEVYKIPPNQLFITYFGGNPSLCLPPDEECKDIWLSLGVAADHILPFGMKDNFWEMGLIGPCGPCSEIHVNKANLETSLARELVNRGSEDVIEIWNLVFMQYNRTSPEVLEKLPAHHIDTGMGLERLVSFLQNKKSNYDTDLFLPLIDAIHKISGGNPYRNSYDMLTEDGQRDWAYRLLADHSRMMTVALADGAFPDSNHRLRRVMRQAIVTGRKWFNQDASLLLELSQRVADMLGGVYPELARNLSNVHTLLRFEEDVFRDHLSKSGRQWSAIINQFPELSTLPEDQQPGIIAGLGQLESWKKSTSDSSLIPGSFAFKLYSTHGTQEESIQMLARLNGCTVDWPEFHRFIANERMATKLQTATKSTDGDESASLDQFQCSSLNVPATVWLCQDVCHRTPDGVYTFLPLEATVTAVIGRGGAPLMDRAVQASVGDRVAVVTDKTCFYYEAGGQVSDTGRLIWPSGEARVEQVRLSGDYIYHLVRITDGSLAVNQTVRMVLDEDDRVRTMANHTATHLLQAALKAVLAVTCQKSSHVTANHFRFDFGLFQSELTVEMISRAESTVRHWIGQRLSVDRLMLPLHQVLSMDGVTLVPGECYPDTVSVIRVAADADGQANTDRVISLEPCCGTHVRNTADLEEFTILSVKSSGIGSRSVRAVTRQTAKKCLLAAKHLQSQLDSIQENLQLNSATNLNQLRDLDNSLIRLRASIEKEDIPLVASKELLSRLEKLESLVRKTVQEALARMMQHQVEVAVSDAGPTSPFVIARLSIPADMLAIGRAKLSLIKATRHCANKPILVLAVEDGCLVGRCTVPEEMTTKTFDAEKWGRYVIEAIGGKGSSPKGQDPRLNFNMRSSKLVADRQQEIQQRAESLARDYYAQSHL